MTVLDFIHSVVVFDILVAQGNTCGIILILN